MRVHDENSADARQLANLLLSFDMVQHVRGPTPRAGNTLDLVITFADRPPNDVSVDPPGAISDHALVVSSIPVSVDSPPLSERLVYAAGDVLTVISWPACCRPVRCAAQRRRLPRTPTSTSCSTHTTASWSTWRISWRRRTSSVVALVVLRRGLTPTVEHIAVNVIVSNVATDAHTALTTVVVG